MTASCPPRLPNGLRFVEGSDACPEYIREAAVPPSPAALRIGRDLLSDTNAAAGRMWRLAATFEGLAKTIRNGPEEAAHAIVTGLVEHGNFTTLTKALRNVDRHHHDTHLHTDDVESLCLEIGSIEQELLAHVASTILHRHPKDSRCLTRAP
jgi:hypothetical protein